ncbi:MAG: hypothetical protein RKH07_16530 [Gammaproteobacteria bacterium]
MRELTLEEQDKVVGGSYVADGATEGGAFGSLAGAVITNTVRGAVTGGAWGAVAGASFGFGYSVGSYIYDQTS